MTVSAPVSSVRITYFQAEKLYTSSGGRTAAQLQSSPYRVTTYVGPELGLLGSLPGVLFRMHDINIADAANQEAWHQSESSLLQKIRRHCLARRRA